MKLEVLDYWDKIKYDNQMLEIILKSDTFAGSKLSIQDKIKMANIINFYVSHKQECLVIKKKFGKKFLCDYVLEKVSNIWG